MKIIVTGHTQGIGQTIFNHFVSNGHTCIGYSRSNGYDISDSVIQDKIIAESSDADIFIHNAWHPTGQLELLQKNCESWKSKNKTIVNISSFIGDYLELNVDPMFQPYIESKRQLDDFCKDHVFKAETPWVVNLKPEIVETPFSDFLPGSKMSTTDVVKILDFVIDISPTIRITTIGFKTNRARDWS
jgi:hypothetical protein